MMKSSILHSLICVIVLATATSHTVREAEPAIKWTGQKLTWKNFLGQPDPDAHGDAATAIRITADPFYKRKKLNYVIEAYFIPSKSWYRDTTAQLLAHEQLHFDLAELYARRARKAVYDLQRSGENDPAVYHTAVQNILTESNVADAAYDQETLHGSLPVAQASWKFKTEAELAILNPFRSKRL